jgi:hypothetical protein
MLAHCVAAQWLFGMSQGQPHVGSCVVDVTAYISVEQVLCLGSGALMGC